MNQSLAFLDYEVALLLAKHGQDAVLGSLASNLKMAPDELLAYLRKIPVRRVPGARIRKRAPAEALELLRLEDKEKESVLRVLALRFENRTWLPELREVRRFFEQRNQPIGRLKSRTDAFPRLLKLISSMRTEDLRTLAQANAEGSYSSLGVISDEILRRDR